MITQHQKHIILPIIVLILGTMACALPLPQTAKPNATATPTPLATISSPTGSATPAAGLAGGGIGGSGGGSSGGGGSGGAGGNNGGTGGSSGNGTGNNPTPSQLPDIYIGPYTVKQIQTLGGEVISGVACDPAKPFFVNSTTPKVSFVFNFAPQDANRGNVSYSYSIPSAGEAHDAKGSYTISSPDKDGTLHLSLAVSDHVTFHGFDGNIPLRYKFDLIPDGNATCPGTPY